MTGTAHLLVGPDAGRGRAGGALDTVAEEAAAAGVKLIDITGTDVAASEAAARAVVAEGAERLLVVGGDGLVHLGLQAVAETETVLGVVPVGTGNDFARGVTGIEEPVVRDAVRTALGPASALDAIRTDAGWVASVATAGFSGDVNGRANRLRFPRGPSRYTVATLAELPGLRTHDVAITADEDAYDGPATLIAVANTAWFGGGMQICPDARPDDGLLDITIVADVGRIELLRFFRLVFSGRHLSHPKVHTLRGRAVTVEVDDLDVWGDGELLGPAVDRLEAVPGALRLATPTG